MTRRVAATPVRSYRTISTLPARDSAEVPDVGGVISVALSRGFPRVGVTDHLRPVVSGLSSKAYLRDCSARPSRVAPPGPGNQPARLRRHLDEHAALAVALADAHPGRRSAAADRAAVEDVALLDRDVARALHGPQRDASAGARPPARQQGRGLHPGAGVGARAGRRALAALPWKGEPSSRGGTPSRKVRTP